VFPARRTLNSALGYLATLKCATSKPAARCKACYTPCAMKYRDVLLEVSVQCDESTARFALCFGALCAEIRCARPCGGLRKRRKALSVRRKSRDQHLPARTRLRDGFGSVRGFFSTSRQNEYCGTHFGAAEPCAAKPPLNGCRWVGKWEPKKIRSCSCYSGLQRSERRITEQHTL
jgi:hypothetical protein